MSLVTWRSATRFVVLGMLGAATLTCHDGATELGVDIGPDTRGDTSILDVAFPDSATDVATDTSEVVDADGQDGDGASEVEAPCAEPGGFGCACVGAGDCLDGVCLEGPDGNVCSRNCIETCPEGYDCRTTSIGGADPVTVCVPRHTRLCRPCMTGSDCQNPLDASPAVCLAAADPSQGSFCATACDSVPCPDGYSCGDVAVGDATRRLCLPDDGTCECRDAWSDLGLQTSCARVSDAGTCLGTRTCGVDGLTDCSARVPATETCNGVDDDCNATPDDVAPVACDNTNDFGTCHGTAACTPDGRDTCVGRVPASEVCNGDDDDCDGATDEAWPNCLPSDCIESEGGYFETGAPTCVTGQCAYPDPKPCGLYTCEGGGDAGVTCATTCDDDTTCVPTAHCDEASHTCVGDVPDGGACGDASDCASGHCQNAFCCEGGDCCRQPSDCPADYREAARCENPEQCQGSRRDAQCVDSVCATSEPVADDSGCSRSVLAIDCTPNAPRYCNGDAAQTAPVCATDCEADADCAGGFHCDGACVPDVTDGATCDEDTDCQGRHCENGFCCSGGTCCGVAEDCPDSFRDPPTCNDAFTCQGERIDATCKSHVCDSATVQDDSGCDANVEANACGAFSSVYCNGAVIQQPPQCKFACAADGECDNGFHCDVVCVPNLPDGNFCDEDTDCTSDHCTNGLCCGSGDCCNRASDCPETYYGDPQCDNNATCQGTREAPICSNHICDKVPGSPDDSACTNAVVASDCGAYPTVRCNGSATQVAPACATSCSSNGECDTDSFCDPTHVCKPKKTPGSSCTDSAQCDTGHCQNGYCCGSGDCCATKADCSPAVYGTSSVCEDVATCQGDKKEPACSASFQCQIGATVGDDSACAGGESDTCGYFISVFCSAATDQVAPSCRTACNSDNQCDNGAHCDLAAGVCKPDEGVGGACTVSNTCQLGLTCVDDRCCQSTCTGACRRCDVDGSPGVCSSPPAGTDPDGDCGAISCTGYYYGFTGSTCYARADLTADQVACGGDGACQTAGDLCPGAAKGAATTSCHPTCQVPTDGTCSGTTPGACTNITGGPQSCGVGACKVTVDSCVDGAPQACTPGPKGLEVCNGIDDDCDGLTDAADPDMQLVPCDNQKGVCSGSVKPASLCVGGAWQPCTDAIYLAWSPKYEAGAEVTCDGGRGVDNDCDGVADDDFTYTGPDGTKVKGAGNACGVGICAGGVTQCAIGNKLVCSTDSRITTETCNAKDDDCDGLTDSLDSSLQLVLCSNQAGVCAGAMTTSRLCAAGSWQACGTPELSANSPIYESDETLCDGKDNDCNSLTDDGLSPPLNSNQKGVCAGSVQSCGGVNGWQDSYSAATIPNYDPNESTPDANYRDENCDGIDGNVNNGIFVVHSNIIYIFGNPVNFGGTDSVTCGTSMASGWCATVKYAVETRSSERSQVYVQAGSFTDGTIVVPRSVAVYGGYDASWNRASRATNPVNIYGGTGTGEAITIKAQSVGTAASPVLFADLNLNGTAAVGSGKSSYVIWAKSARVTLQRVTVSAANGAAGATGFSGTNASSLVAPNVGGTGGGASEYSTSCGLARPGGGGGTRNDCTADAAGGYSQGGGGGSGGAMDTSCYTTCPCFGGCCVDYCDNCDASSGAWGGGGFSTGSSSDGGGGSGGAGGSTCGGGGGGTAGGSSHGSKGTGATNPYGSIASDLFSGYGGGNGGLGSHGGGGGGGGGSGGCDIGTDSTGAGGGGGGAGGCRARAAGTGGGAGGGSFAIFAVDSFLNVTSSAFARANGGAGGTGGAGAQGQPGGQGGAGGTASGDSAAGGNGGTGGQGGHSGAGGGGAGGPSYAIFWYRSSSGAGSVTQSGNDFGVSGGGGSGGAGGTGTIAATTGTSGVTGGSGNICELVGSSCQ